MLFMGCEFIVSPFIESVSLFEVWVKDLRSSFTKYGSAAARSWGQLKIYREDFSIIQVICLRPVDTTKGLYHSQSLQIVYLVLSPGQLHRWQGSPRAPIVTRSHYDRIMQPPVSTGCPPNINIALVISPDIYFTFSSVRAVLAMNEMIQHGGHI